ncbi:S-adenosyl-L-methionine-dependent methyltransferase [Lophiotrema nucula]|uniref:S-adenosyl-L-methionine-dependent methyltransferase n=1 Tax=Lophiotrema nucula TaxID=690887 RepID=A0A6A5ZK66_9PLEO|nr:S-adenosyl-L-methionine-dependent methyltransferase [Lophiotrema nucula]
MGVTSNPLESSNQVFAQDKDFWNHYLKGRPSVPPQFFSRLFAYHSSRSNGFVTAHDVGAGNGPYSATLRSKFSHVIVSDIAPDNVRFAEARLGTDGYSYRASRVEDVDDIPPGSVDMVFATNVLHFCDQDVAMASIARQLRSGGTFACAAFGAARFDDERVQQLYTKLGQVGARELLKTLSDSEKLVQAMARTKGAYNVAPLDAELWRPGAQRIHLNMPPEGMTSPLPPEIQVEEPVYAGVDDVAIFEEEEGWGFVMDLAGVREHLESFPFGRDSGKEFAELWGEIEKIVGNGSVRGHWPAKVILATRR